MRLAVTEPDQYADTLAAHAARLFDGLCAIALLSADGTVLRIAAVGTGRPELDRRLGTLRGEPFSTVDSGAVAVAVAGAAGQAVRTAAPVQVSGENVVAGWGSHPAIRQLALGRRFAARPDGRPLTATLVPVVVRHEVIGIVAVLRCSVEAAPVEAAPVAALATLAADAAPCLEVVRAHTRSVRRAAHAAILIDRAQHASTPEQPSDDDTRRLIEATAAALRARCWLSRPATGHGELIADTGPPSAAPPPLRPTPGHDPTTLWSPVPGPAGPLGWLGAGRHTPFDTDERQFLRTLAGQLAGSWLVDTITAERDAAQADLRLNEERFRLVFDQAPLGMALIDLAGPTPGTIIEVNQSFVELTGRPADELLRLDYGELVGRTDAAADLLRHGGPAHHGRATDDRESRLIRPDGTVLWVQNRLVAIHRDGRPWRAILHSQDITARRTMLAELERRTLHDPLTQLGNRGLLLDHLRLALAGLDRSPGVVAVLFLDLDRFKVINDTQGHDTGDQVLREVARRLTDAVRSSDTVARIAGDEFVVAAPVREEAEAVLLAERIQDALEGPITISGADSGRPDQLLITASIGVATSDRPDADPAELLRQSDLAMYQAKHAAHPGPHGGSAGSPTLRRWQVYHEAFNRRLRQREDTLRMLQDALEQGWFRLRFQPIFDLADDRIVAAEALLRLQHPERGLLGPATFIDVAEQNDIILPIGQWVLTETMRQLKDWRRRYGIEIAVNVSGRQVSRRAIGSQLLTAAEAAGYAGGRMPEGLCLEVTERVALEADDEIVADLRTLCKLGVRLALDDFGTGYASLQHVRKLPVDELKIDRSFVSGLGIDADDTAIVRAVSALAASLSLGVVAEGVESAGQLAVLRSLKCRRAQGFLLGRPMEAEQLSCRLDQQAS